VCRRSGLLVASVAHVCGGDRLEIRSHKPSRQLRWQLVECRSVQRQERRKLMGQQYVDLVHFDLDEHRAAGVLSLSPKFRSLNVESNDQPTERAEHGANEGGQNRLRLHLCHLGARALQFIFPVPERLGFGLRSCGPELQNGDDRRDTNLVQGRRDYPPNSLSSASSCGSEMCSAPLGPRKRSTDRSRSCGLVRRPAPAASASGRS